MHCGASLSTDIRSCQRRAAACRFPSCPSALRPRPEGRRSSRVAGAPVCGCRVATVMDHRGRIGMFLSFLESPFHVGRGGRACSDKGKAEGRVQTGIKETGRTATILRGGCMPRVCLEAVQASCQVLQNAPDSTIDASYVSGCVKMLGNGRFENAEYKSEAGDRRKHIWASGEPGGLSFNSPVGLSCGNFCLR